MSKSNQTELVLGTNRYIKPPNAAELLGVSVSWLAKMRVRGGGPVYVKVGRGVRYPEDQLVAWLESRTRRSTSDNRTAA